MIFFSCVYYIEIVEIHITLIISTLHITCAHITCAHLTWLSLFNSLLFKIFFWYFVWKNKNINLILITYKWFDKK